MRFCQTLQINPPVVDIPFKDQQCDGAEEQPPPKSPCGKLAWRFAFDLFADFDLVAWFEIGFARIEDVDGDFLRDFFAGAFANVVHAQVVGPREDKLILGFTIDDKLLVPRRANRDLLDRR